MMNILKLITSKLRKRDVKSDLSLLHDTQHMFDLLCDDPYCKIIDDVKNIINRQVQGARLIHFNAVSKPDWLTGTIDDESGQSMVSRLGVAFAFELLVENPDKSSESLSGIYSCVVWQINQPEHTNGQIWFDLNGDLQEFGSEGKLKERLLLR